MASGGFRVTRIQLNFFAHWERRLLTSMCARLPAAVEPDHLTCVSVLGALVVFGGCAASRSDTIFLWVASIGLVLNWLGDSLDGSLARYRRIERPTYGYFLDHTVDAFNNLVMMVGIGLTAGVRMDVALFALIGYYLLCMYVFINNHLSGIFHLSFLGCGPTELRICLILINTAMYCFGTVGWSVDGHFLSIYDAILLGAAMAFIVVFLAQIVGGIRKLRTTDMGRQTLPQMVRCPPAQSFATKASSSSK